MGNTIDVNKRGEQLFDDVANRALQNGNKFMTSLKVAGMASAATNGLLFIVPTGTVVPMLTIELTAAGTASYVLYEKTTAGQNGTTIASWNMNRDSTKLPSIVIAQMARTYANTTAIFSAMSTFGVKDKTPEIVLATATTYGLELTAGTLGGDVQLTLYVRETT